MHGKTNQDEGFHNRTQRSTFSIIFC